MYKVNKLILSATALTVGMMTSATTLANATADNNTQQPTAQQQTPAQGVNYINTSAEEQQKEQVEELGIETDFRISDSGAEQLKERLGETKTAGSTHVTSNGGGNFNTTGSTTNAATTYPRFSEEEMANLAMIQTKADETGEESSIGDEIGNPGENGLEYREEVAVLYQHLPENPIYTYGVDGSERGECTGTECEKFNSIWDKFAEQQANGKLLIVMEEGERQGKIVMPETFAQDVKHQPSIVGSSQGTDCPEGYTASEGNEYKSGAHCGNLVGSTYYVAASQK